MADVVVEDVKQDVLSDVAVDSGSGVGEFAGAAGNCRWAPGTGGTCGLGGSSVGTPFTITGYANDVVVDPVGTNGAVTFKLKAGTTNTLEASNLNILGTANNTCLMTKVGTQIELSCSNIGGFSCNQTGNKS